MNKWLAFIISLFAKTKKEEEEIIRTEGAIQ
jgi:hypothetical protein